MFSPSTTIKRLPGSTLPKLLIEPIDELLLETLHESTSLFLYNFSYSFWVSPLIGLRTCETRYSTKDSTLKKVTLRQVAFQKNIFQESRTPHDKNSIFIWWNIEFEKHAVLFNDFNYNGVLDSFSLGILSGELVISYYQRSNRTCVQSSVQNAPAVTIFDRF